MYFSDSGRLTLSRRHPIFCDVCFAAVLVCVSRQLIAGSIRVWYYPTWPTSQQWGIGVTPVLVRETDSTSFGHHFEELGQIPRDYFARLASCET